MLCMVGLTEPCLQRLAAKQQVEQQTRAEKVFHMRPRTPNKQPTTPQPFRLRTQYVQVRIYCIDRKCKHICSKLCYQLTPLYT